MLTTYAKGFSGQKVRLKLQKTFLIIPDIEERFADL